MSEQRQSRLPCTARTHMYIQWQTLLVRPVQARGAEWQRVGRVLGHSPEHQPLQPQLQLTIAGFPHCWARPPPPRPLLPAAPQPHSPIPSNTATQRPVSAQTIPSYCLFRCATGTWSMRRGMAECVACHRQQGSGRHRCESPFPPHKQTHPEPHTARRHASKRNQVRQTRGTSCQTYCTFIPPPI